MPEDFSKPVIEYPELWPLFAVFAVACLGVVVEAFFPRERRYLTQVGLATSGLVAALVGTLLIGRDLEASEGARGLVAASGTIVIDGPTIYLWVLMLVFSLGGVALFAERRLEAGVSAFAGQAATLPGTEAECEASTRGLDHTEVYPLMMFAVTGMLLFPAAGDLLTLFVALEILSLPLYLLCGLARRRRLLSQEAALKYFLLGAFSSGFFLYGIALIYGFSGSMQFTEISQAVRNSEGNDSLLLIGIGMLAVGLLFKVGAVPFHNWTPDVYQGAPTAVTAFMSACTKIAAFGALLRLFYVAFGSDRWSWLPMLWVIAILSMLVGSMLAVVQSDVKRMLAYSSVSHTGFLLTGVLGVQAAGDLAPGEISALQAVLFYLTTYGFAMVGGFAILTLVRDSGGEATSFDKWAGIGRRSPLVAGAFAFLLLSMAGIPLTAGFVGKWAVFTAALGAKAWPVVLVAILASVISVFFYARLIRVMFFSSPGPGAAAVNSASPLTTGTIALCVLGTLALGVYPDPVLDLAARAGDFIR